MPRIRNIIDLFYNTYITYYEILASGHNYPFMSKHGRIIIIINFFIIILNYQ